MGVGGRNGARGRRMVEVISRVYNWCHVWGGWVVGL